jgi:hypothetical protein
MAPPGPTGAPRAAGRGAVVRAGGHSRRRCAARLGQGPCNQRARSLTHQEVLKWTQHRSSSCAPTAPSGAAADQSWAPAAATPLGSWLRKAASGTGRSPNKTIGAASSKPGRRSAPWSDPRRSSSSTRSSADGKRASPDPPPLCRPPIGPTATESEHCRQRRGQASERDRRRVTVRRACAELLSPISAAMLIPE